MKIDSLFLMIPGLVDASVRTEVTVRANVYDERTLDDGGCDPDGCEPSKTRDSDLDGSSRWSCARSLENKTCRYKCAIY